MPRTKTRTATITAAVRTMRDALAVTKRAVEAWRSADEGCDDVANGMRTLLAELNVDKDGNDTLDAVAELLDEHVERLSESPPQGHVLAHALGNLGSAAQTLNRLTRTTGGVGPAEAATEDLANPEQMLSSAVTGLAEFFNALELSEKAQADAAAIAVTLRRVRTLVERARGKLAP